MRRPWRWFRGLPALIQVGLVVLAAFGLLSLDWRPAEVKGTPRLADAGHAWGQLRAGAARVSIDPPFPTPIGGFPRGGALSTGVLNPMSARALVMEVGGRRYGLLSVELVLVPAPLRQRVLAQVGDLHLDDVLIGATHTHSGLGGYWHNHIAQEIGLGPYDPRVEKLLAERLAQALREAASALQPARMAVGRIEASRYGYNRDQANGPVDNLLTGVRITSPDGHAIANVVIYGVHPTIVPPEEHRLSGDWPGALMSALEAEGGPTTLFFQGASGDVTWGKREGEMTRQERAVRFGQAVAGDARGALAAGGEGSGTMPLGWARVTVGLPKCDVSGAVWRPFAPLASNVFCWLAWPGTTQVSYLRAGPLELAGVPGEPVASLGIDWRTALGGAQVIGLADDYVGYVETPSAMKAGTGEAKRSYFGPALATRLFSGLNLARDAVLAGSPEVDGKTPGRTMSGSRWQQK